MTEGQRPFGGTNDSEGSSGSQPEHAMVSEDTANSPRAAQGPMSGDVTSVPEGGSDDPDAKSPGIADATGPQG